MARNGVSINPERLTEARELRGFTITDLAKRINKTRQNISSIENGASQPGADTLNAISEVLSIPIGFFSKTNNREKPINSTIFYRSMRSTLANQRQQSMRWLQLLIRQYSLYSEYVFFPETNLFQYDGDFEELTNADIESIATKTRRYWDLGDGPISNLTLLLENNGLIISHVDIGTDKLDACSTFDCGRCFILLNTKKSTCSRVLANLAHELGHLVLHGGVSPQEINDSAKLEQIEKQAWRFASAFLMPASSFFSELHTTSLSAFTALKSRWRTSIAAMIMRCSESGIIDDYRKQYLFREMGRKNIRLHEPYDDELPIEKPQLLLDADRLLLKEKILTRESLLDLTSLYSEDYGILIGADPSYFSQIRNKPRLYLVK